MEIISNKSKKGLLRSAQEKLATLFEQHKNDAVLFLSSGGSALELLEGIPAEALDNDTTISVLDERLSADQAINNFLRLKKMTVEDSARHGSRYFKTVPQKGETVDEFAARHEAALREWREKNPSGVIIATLGIGADGHTAGIMPYPEDRDFFEKFFIKTDAWIAGYDAGDKSPFPLRVTATIHFLRKEVDHAVVYAAGEEKRRALERVLTNEGTLSETPARVIREMKSTTLFTDMTR